MKTAKKSLDRIARKRRVRARIVGSAERPRLAVFKSLNAIYAQVVDDATGRTLVSANSLKVKKGSKAEKAAAVGKAIAEAAKSAKVETVVFDRGGFLYAGRVKILADAAREAGLKF
ncbi:MAG: 50S ribosomal protein L18 [Candidatus Peribacteraceae bacterium]|nr:50S ribosomal protein L18 [Candidatus Peribacteraceae bacterium]